MKKSLLLLLALATTGGYGFSQNKVDSQPLKVRNASHIHDGQNQTGINGIPTGTPNWSVQNFDQGTNDILDCEAVNVPYTQDFSSAVVPGMPECTTVENAGTGNNWHTYSGTDGGFTGTYLRYQWHSSNAANSWFYTQGINMTEGITYTVSYDYGTESAGTFPESLKVAFGTENTSTAMTNVLAVHEDFVTSEQAVTNVVEFTPETTGVYYIGFNAFSDANMFYMYLDNIKVESTEVIAEECEWTVNISGPGYGDEVSWELRDANGVILEGGDYDEIGFNDIQTVTAAGPLEFYIEAMGTWGDNEVTYVISNANGIQASGDLEGDDEATHSDMNCEDEGEEPTYCEPELDCTDDDLITNVTFQEIDNDSECGENGYANYTSMVANVEAGGTYPINVTVGAGWAYESVSVWIDYNNNYIFEENEFTYIGTGTAETLTGDIVIPADLAEGQYRMRVRVAAVGEATATWDMACNESQGYGETEDYTINVGEINNGGESCEQSTPSNAFENGHGFIHTATIAHDFHVAEGTEFTVQTFALNVMNTSATTDVSLTFYKSEGGQPGEFIQEFANIVPTSQTTVGTAFGFNVVNTVVDLPTALTLEGEAGGSDYFVAVTVTNANNTYWESTSTLNTNNGGYYSPNGGETWSALTGGPWDGVFTISGECALLGAEEISNFDFAYYPNPAKEVLNIQSQKAVKSVQVFNLAGQQVMANAKVANGQINVSALPQGTYVFRVALDGGAVETFKIIKK
jgi:hypothetical protein